ncbi:MAG: hypothetical protein ACRDOH_08460 [Streptosporangiaceae bacterium]
MGLTFARDGTLALGVGLIPVGRTSLVEGHYRGDTGAVAALVGPLDPVAAKYGIKQNSPRDI